MSPNLKYRPYKILVVLKRPLRWKVIILETIFNWTIKVGKGGKRRKFVSVYLPFLILPNVSSLGNIVTINSIHFHRWNSKHFCNMKRRIFFIYSYIRTLWHVSYIFYSKRSLSLSLNLESSKEIQVLVLFEMNLLYSYSYASLKCFIYSLYFMLKFHIFLRVIKVFYITILCLCLYFKKLI